MVSGKILTGNFKELVVILTLKFPVSIFPFSLKPIYETGILWLNQESMCQWLPLATTGYHWPVHLRAKMCFSRRLSSWRPVEPTWSAERSGTIGGTVRKNYRSYRKSQFFNRKMIHKWTIFHSNISFLEGIVVFEMGFLKFGFIFQGLTGIGFYIKDGGFLTFLVNHSI